MNTLATLTAPRSALCRLGIRVASYAENKSNDITFDTTVEGPAIRVVKEVVSIVQQRTGVSARFGKSQLERQDRPPYVVFSLRERLVNAVEFTAEEYASATGVSERQARRDLAQMEALGLLERRGKGSATTYRKPPSLRK